jgi:hypothetical protein
MLRMLDDYKSGNVSQKWALSTYSTFEDAYSETAYEEVKGFRYDEGETVECYAESSTDYDKLYELKNLSRFVYYNGVRYFYFIQGKLDQIVEVEKAYYFDLNVGQLYDFIHTTNPIDLVLLSAAVPSNQT